MDFGEFLGGIGTVDLLIVLYFIGFFVLGFAQGTIRRLIGIGFDPLLVPVRGQPGRAARRGSLVSNWTQFSRQYSYMIGFGTVFVAAALAFALVVQGFYKPQPLFAKARFADEIIGGLLGLVQAAHHLRRRAVILDSFFLIPGIARTRRSCRSCATSGTALDPRRSRTSSGRRSSRLLRGHRASSSPTHRGRSTRALGLSVVDRGVLAGARRLEAGRALLGARLVRDDDDRPARRPHRRGRGLHRAGRPGLACPVRRDGPQPGHVRAARASPTCTLSTGCTTASTW